MNDEMVWPIFTDSLLYFLVGHKTINTVLKLEWEATLIMQKGMPYTVFVSLISILLWNL